MLVLHANWMDGALHVWGESLEGYLNSPRFAADAPASSPRSATAVAEPIAATHPFAINPADLRQALPTDLASSIEDSTIRLRLPRDDHGPWPSDRLSRKAGAIESPIDPWLDTIEIPSLTIPANSALAALLQLDQQEPSDTIEFASSLRYWIAVANFIADLLADQRFVPIVIESRGHRMKGAWQPWVHDDDVRKKLGELLRAMPPVARAGIDRHEHQPSLILDEALRLMTDAAVRSALVGEQFIDALDGRDAAGDPHVAWLSGLLDWKDEVSGNGAGNGSSNGASTLLLREASQWIARLDDRGQDRPLHLCLQLSEPAAIRSGANPDDVQWPLTLHLQSPDNPHDLIDAEHIWGQSSATSGLKVHASNSEDSQAILLAELGRASRMYPKIETALEEKHPTGLSLTTAEAHQFLREYRPLLEESGIVVLVPEWWDQPVGRLAARLHIDAPPTDLLGDGDGTSPASSMLGLNTLVQFRWQVAIGDQPLTPEELQTLAQQVKSAPLVQVRGRWIEISPQQLADAREFLERTPAGEMPLLEAIQLAHGAGSRNFNLPVLGLDATGWVADFLHGTGENHTMPLIEQPTEFLGTLRPYQKMGLSWLTFLDRYGLGACLADDMGLGKTIQLIALLQHERQMSTSRKVDKSTETGTAFKHGIGPTLLVVPTSVVANWARELSRFAPNLTAHVHHGAERPLGDRFVEIAEAHDLVITTYPLISRDIETLKRCRWHRVTLDEAQYIKNPPTKQTMAIRSLNAPRRIALTGTPVENRLSELWSIMEFCNPGYLGSAGEFRRRFGIPIERHRNRLQADHLRDMVRPFVLRRVKTDPKVISDLPDLTETKEYATLTVEQATMYQDIVNGMLQQVDRAAGIQRRGLVLATLVRLKQICNHPEQAKISMAAHATAVQTEDAANEDDQSPQRQIVASPSQLSPRSGKAKRLMVMLEEVIASGEKALIFTQFRQMGHLLTSMIQNELDAEALFLHGGTPAAKRQGLIDRFQADDGGAPIFVLSLKAGGLGLNLTAANHVFHYDRWWNPAVENQATDRAFRIGQMRAVQVHKFVCLGTLEERIDQMIEQKTDLAQNIIGSGEQWLTELTTNQLHDLLILRPSAMEGDA